MANLKDFQITRQLICQVPMIHFQPDQSGVGLRATEVKPKLDRFLLKKYKEHHGGHPKEEKNWMIADPNGQVPHAFSYKMNIRLAGDRNNDRAVRPHNMFYGNMGSGGDKKQLKGNYILTITSFVPELLKFIDDNIDEFFIVTNFGTMQGKGFGSYVTPQGQNLPAATKAKYLREMAGAKCCYMIGTYADGTKTERIKNRNTGEKEQITRSCKKEEFMLDDIKKLYSVMKSGYNINGSYMRSYLFQYFHLSDIGNEKAFMKQKKISPVIGRPCSPQISKKHYYVRALLGTGEKIEYIKKLNNGRPDFSAGKAVIKIKNDTIERFPSPIFFKIIGDTIYMVAKRIDNRIYGKAFTFSNQSGASVSLNVPSEAEFDIDDFLAYFVKQYMIDSKAKPRERYSFNKQIKIIQ